MIDDSLHQAALAALRVEMDAIHSANKLYCNREERSREADVDHQQRRERLEQIRKKMEELLKN
jgi:hypothetical protein